MSEARAKAGTHLEQLGVQAQLDNGLSQTKQELEHQLQAHRASIGLMPIEHELIVSLQCLEHTCPHALLNMDLRQADCCEQFACPITELDWARDPV